MIMLFANIVPFFSWSLCLSFLLIEKRTSIKQVRCKNYGIYNFWISLGFLEILEVKSNWNFYCNFYSLGVLLFSSACVVWEETTGGHGFFVLDLWFMRVQLGLTSCHNWLLSPWFISVTGYPKDMGEGVICVLACMCVVELKENRFGAYWCQKGTNKFHCPGSAFEGLQNTSIWINWNSSWKTAWGLKRKLKSQKSWIMNCHLISQKMTVIKE